MNTCGTPGRSVQENETDTNNGQTFGSKKRTFCCWSPANRLESNPDMACRCLLCVCARVHVCLQDCLTLRKGLILSSLWRLPTQGVSRGSLVVVFLVLFLNSPEHLSWHTVSFASRVASEFKSNGQTSAHLRAWGRSWAQKSHLTCLMLCSQDFKPRLPAPWPWLLAFLLTLSWGLVGQLRK